MCWMNTNARFIIKGTNTNKFLFGLKHLYYFPLTKVRIDDSHPDKHTHTHTHTHTDTDIDTDMQKTICP